MPALRATGYYPHNPILAFKVGNCSGAIYGACRQGCLITINVCAHPRKHTYIIAQKHSSIVGVGEPGIMGKDGITPCKGQLCNTCFYRWKVP